ncbi:MAG: hypothetical protein J7578_22520 [Chitinophagaceae bacterium]|nr:hypothetical protein [Chitinophagaceae bacterium]
MYKPIIILSVLVLAFCACSEKKRPPLLKELKSNLARFVFEYDEQGLLKKAYAWYDLMGKGMDKQPNLTYDFRHIPDSAMIRCELQRPDSSMNQQMDRAAITYLQDSAGRIVLIIRGQPFENGGDTGWDTTRISWNKEGAITSIARDHDAHMKEWDLVNGDLMTRHLKNQWTPFPATITYTPRYSQINNPFPKDRNYILLTSVLQQYALGNLLFDHEFLYSRHLPESLITNRSFADPSIKDSLWTGEKLEDKYKYEFDAHKNLVLCEVRFTERSVSNGREVADSTAKEDTLTWHFRYQ